MSKYGTWIKSVAFGLAIAGMALTSAVAKKPGTGCPRDMGCPDVYNPVTCSNGVTYPNACYAYVACATGCGAS